MQVHRHLAQLGRHLVRRADDDVAGLQDVLEGAGVLADLLHLRAELRAGLAALALDASADGRFGRVARRCRETAVALQAAVLAILPRLILEFQPLLPRLVSATSRSWAATSSGVPTMT